MSLGSLDKFHCGLFITNIDRVIVDINAYVENEFGFSKESLIGQSISYIFTKSSVLFFESYLLPILQLERSSEELQLSMRNFEGKVIPVTVNAVVHDEMIYWSFFTAISRNKLYDSLNSAKNQIEQQALHLKTLSMTDDLTELPNRRGFDMQSERLVNISKQQGLDYALFLIDIDNFKVINDQYGHDEGDRVLKELGGHFGKFGRHQDLWARYGGEEFILMVADCALERANMLANKLHKLVSMVKIENRSIQVSIGLTIGTEAFDVSFKQADKALYKAKASGKSTTAVYYNE